VSDAVFDAVIVAEFDAVLDAVFDAVIVAEFDAVLDAAFDAKFDAVLDAVFDAVFDAGPRRAAQYLPQKIPREIQSHLPFLKSSTTPN
jgi:hypothetical protein